MGIGRYIVLLSLVITACTSSEQRAKTRLETELGLRAEPHFPKCLSQEISPRAAVRAGDFDVAHTVYNPHGDIPIDECARWDTNEPVGGAKESTRPVVLAPLLPKRPKGSQEGQAPEGGN